MVFLIVKNNSTSPVRTNQWFARPPKLKIGITQKLHKIQTHNT